MFNEPALLFLKLAASPRKASGPPVLLKPFDDAQDPAVKLFTAKGLVKIVRGSVLQKSGGQAFRRRRGDADDRHVIPGMDLADDLRQLHTVHAGHFKVGDDEVDAVLTGERLQGLLPVFGGQDLKAERSEGGADGCSC